MFLHAHHLEGGLHAIHNFNVHGSSNPLNEPAETAGIKAAFPAAGAAVEFDLPLAPTGTPFQMEVWELLRTIPRGETTTYGALARRVGGQRGWRMPAAQAIDGAVGRNPISIIIPCHRIIGADGSLTGYAGGLDRKAALLALEKAGFHPG